MWWLAIPPAVAVGAFAVKKMFEKSEPVSNVSGTNVAVFYARKAIKKEDNNVNKSGQNSHLESNFQKLDKILSNHFGSIKIAIIGQPGAGKSAMLSGITSKRCLPLPVIGQKTDATFWHKGPISQGLYSLWRNGHTDPFDFNELW